MTRIFPCRAVFAALVLMFAFGFAVMSASACPNCKYSNSEGSPPKTDSSEMTALGRGYNYSILFMMAVPFVLMGAFGGGLYLTLRKSLPAGVTHVHDRR